MRKCRRESGSCRRGKEIAEAGLCDRVGVAASSSVIIRLFRWADDHRRADETCRRRVIRRRLPGTRRVRRTGADGSLGGSVVTTILSVTLTIRALPTPCRGALRAKAGRVPLRRPCRRPREDRHRARQPRPARRMGCRAAQRRSRRRRGRWVRSRGRARAIVARRSPWAGLPERPAPRRGAAGPWRPPLRPRRCPSVAVSAIPPVTSPKPSSTIEPVPIVGKGAPDAGQADPRRLPCRHAVPRRQERSRADRLPRRCLRRHRQGTGPSSVRTVPSCMRRCGSAICSS